MLTQKNEKGTPQDHQGKLFLFGSDPYRRRPVFLSGAAERCIIVLGGQTDGFFAINFVSQLIGEVGKINWCVAQAQLGSSHPGNPANHISDAEDLDELVALLVESHGMSEVAILVCSTAVQIVLQFAQTAKNKIWVSRILLQGVVKDADLEMFSLDSVEKRLQKASELTSSGQGGDFFQMSHFYDIPVSAARVSSGGHLSLQEAVWGPAARGDVDRVRENISALTCPLHIMIARQVEYHNKQQVKETDALASETIKQAANTADCSIAFFNEVCDEHRCMLNTAQSSHTASIMFFLQEQDRLREEREEAAKKREVEDLRRSRSVLAKSSLGK